MSTPPPKFRHVLAGLALVILAIASYFVLATSLGIQQRYPIANIAIALLGCFIALRATKLAFSWPRVAVSLLALALTGFYSWWTLSYSNYEARERQLHVGETAAGIVGLTLQNHAGVEQLVLQPASRTLLVFYRGYW
jgi:hypothetical protein